MVKPRKKRTIRPEMREQLIVIIGVGGLTFMMLAESWTDLGVPEWAKIGIWIAGFAVLLAVDHQSGKRRAQEQEDAERSLSEPTFHIVFLVTLFGALATVNTLEDHYDLSFWARNLIVWGMGVMGVLVIAGLRARWRRTRWKHGRKLRKWPD